jgi:hypothetical protein
MVIQQDTFRLDILIHAILHLYLAKQVNEGDVIKCSQSGCPEIGQLMGSLTNVNMFNG